MPSSVAILLLFFALVAGAVYVFGIPKEFKRELEKKALETMGENKASYFVKDAISQMPEDDRLHTGELKKEANDLTGAALQNPLGEVAGESADQGTSGFTGR